MESQREAAPEACPAAIREPQRVEARARAGSAGKERPEGEEEEDEEVSLAWPALAPPPPPLHDQKWTPPRPAWVAATWLLPTRASACGEDEEGSAPEWPRRAATTAPVEASLGGFLNLFFVFFFRESSRRQRRRRNYSTCLFFIFSSSTSPNRANSPNRDHRVLAGCRSHHERRRWSRREAREGAAGDCRGVGGGEQHLNVSMFSKSLFRTRRLVWA